MKEGKKKMKEEKKKNERRKERMIESAKEKSEVTVFSESKNLNKKHNSRDEG